MQIYCSDTGSLYIALTALILVKVTCCVMLFIIARMLHVDIDNLQQSAPVFVDLCMGLDQFSALLGNLVS
jgi:hypothetical protein